MSTTLYSVLLGFTVNSAITLLRYDELTATKPQLKVVFDQCGTPTYAGNLAETIFTIIEERQYEGKTGIYHSPTKVSAAGMILQ